MTVLDRPTATKRVPMDSLRKTALIGGALSYSPSPARSRQPFFSSPPC